MADTTVDAVPITSRRGLGALLFSLLAIAYLEKTGISYAIKPIGTEYHLSATVEGILLSAFSWGYVIAMAPAGMLIDQAGAKRILGFASLAWGGLVAACTAIGAAWQLIPLRAALGVSEAPVSPGSAQLVASNYETDRRGLGVASFDAGSYLGLALGAPLVGTVGAWVGWRWALFLTGTISIIWWILWRTRASAIVDPTHPDNDPGSLVKLSQVIRQPMIFLMGFGFFGYNYLKSFFLTWFPTYLVDEHGVTARQIGIIGVCPGFAALLAIFAAGAWLDRRVQKGSNPIAARRTLIICGLSVGAIIWPTAIVHQTWLVVLLLCASFAACIATSPGIWGLPIEVAPDASWVGTIGGVQNTLSNIAGITAPIITGALVDITHNFTAALALTAIISLLGAGSYALTKVVPWRMNRG